MLPVTAAKQSVFNATLSADRVSFLNFVGPVLNLHPSVTAKSRKDYDLDQDLGISR